jgi:type VI secretion system secreted protein VgrG
MARLTQEGRAFRVATPLGSDVLLLQRFSGQEGTSTGFHYTLELLSEDDTVDPASLLRKPMVVTVDHPDGERQIHGLVRRFVQSGQSEELVLYRAEIVPWLWFLNLSWNCRIFQNKSILEIAQQVFDGLGYSDYEFRCSRSFSPREYCVQYRESDLNFVSRLFEEEGVFYFFEHTDSKHLLVITDANSALQQCPVQDTVRIRTDASAAQENDVVLGLELEAAVHIGKVTLRDYDFTRPSLNLESTASAQKGEEVYGYPGGYLELTDGERYAELLLEEGQATGKIVRGHGTCRSFQSGYRFTLKEHYRADANTEYLLVQVSHQGEAGDYRSWDSAALQYSNQFVAMPVDVPFRPPRLSLKPRIHGSQTALVVGPSGEEIYTDEYGRVKVQFYWDRLGAKDQNSSCWVRVAYPWAGKGWGAVHIPRIHQEVIVEFLEGDPDRPIITGRVYNAEQTVPYDLPANMTQSGIKSRSSKGAGADNYNEIRMEDKKGSELLYIHAEKDREVQVENDNSETVGHDETISIGNDQTISIGHDQKLDVENDQTISVGGNRSESVEKNETISITGNRTETVGKDETITIDGKRTESVAKDETIEVSGKRTTTIKKEEVLTVKDKRTTDVAKDDNLQVGKNLTVNATDQIILKSGEGSITIKKDGTITIKGKDIKLEASGKINAKAGGDVAIKGSKITQN